MANEPDTSLTGNLDALTKKKASDFDRVCRFEAVKLAVTHPCGTVKERMELIKELYQFLKGEPDNGSQ